MNDDDLLFTVNDLDSYKRGEQPDSWLGDRHEVLATRCRAQKAKLEKLLASASPVLFDRLNKPL